MAVKPDGEAELFDRSTLARLRSPCKTPRPCRCSSADAISRAVNRMLSKAGSPWGVVKARVLTASCRDTTLVADRMHLMCHPTIHMLSEHDKRDYFKPL